MMFLFIIACDKHSDSCVALKCKQLVIDVVSVIKYSEDLYSVYL